MSVVVVCCVMVFVASNPRLLFNRWLFVVVAAVGARGLLFVCVDVVSVFVIYLFVCVFVS